MKIELYGSPGSRAGIAETNVEGATVAEVLAKLAERYPALAAECFEGAGLRAGYVANVNGRRFVVDPATPLDPGDCVLILSADVGG